jgi:hypothetical protein
MKNYRFRCKDKKTFDFIIDLADRKKVNIHPDIRKFGKNHPWIGFNERDRLTVEHIRKYGEMTLSELISMIENYKPKQYIGQYRVHYEKDNIRFGGVIIPNKMVRGAAKSGEIRFGKIHIGKGKVKEISKQLLHNRK